jgi:hypothetical protein
MLMALGADYGHRGALACGAEARTLEGSAHREQEGRKSIQSKEKPRKRQPGIHLGLSEHGFTLDGWYTKPRSQGPFFRVADA